MSLSGLLIFAGVYFLAVALPGPGVAAVIARSLAHGTQGAGAFIAGFLIGDLVWFVFAATGLAALAQTAAMVFVAVKYAGVVYLLYLAYRLWTSPVTAPVTAPDASTGEQASRTARQEASDVTVDRGQSASRLFLGSLALTLGNPKPMIFFLALLPTVVRLETLSVAGFVEIAATICMVLPLVLGGYVLAAARARRVFSSSRALRNLNRGSGVAMASAALVVATH